MDVGGGGRSEEDAGDEAVAVGLGVGEDRGGDESFPGRGDGAES